MDVRSVVWEEPWLGPRPHETVLNYVKDKTTFFTGRKHLPPVENGIKKIFADLNRICEIEDEELEWYERAYFPAPHVLPSLGLFDRLFTIKDEKYAGTDRVVGKIQLQAIRPGELRSTWVGARLVVRKPRAELTNEVKRLGLMIERHAPLELRIGDIFVFYVALGRRRKGGASGISPSRTLPPRHDPLRRSSQIQSRTDLRRFTTSAQRGSLG